MATLGWMLRLTHFGHSCVLADTGETRVLIDPGTLSHGFDELRDLDAVLVTHQHPDHLDLQRLLALMAANPRAQVITDRGSADQLADASVGHRTVGPGDAFAVGDLEVTVVGSGDHAVIHPDIPVVPNNGYLLDGRVLHPGDQFTPPGRQVDVLLLPTGAPWLRIADAIDYLRELAPPLAVPIHQGVLAVPEIYYQHFRNLSAEATEVRVAEPGDPMTI